MPNLETKIEDAACTRIANELGVQSIKLTLYGDAGWPDRLFFVPGGRPFFIEFKVPGKTAEPLQTVRHLFLEYLRYEVEVHDSVEGAFAAVERRVVAATRAGWKHSPKREAELRAKLATALEAARLPKAGGGVPHRAGRRGALPRSRPG